MHIEQIVEMLEAEIVAESDCENLDVSSAFASDLISDIMAFAKENVILITGLISPQVIRAAEMMDIGIVIFVRGKKPDDNMIKMAREIGICLISTRMTMYIACGKLYSSGLRGRGADCWLK
jgi:hypothetical protein